jgi:hypothetical protein
MDRKCDTKMLRIIALILIGHVLSDQTFYMNYKNLQYNKDLTNDVIFHR